jgi:hypothetical protein
MLIWRKSLMKMKIHLMIWIARRWNSLIKNRKSIINKSFKTLSKSIFIKSKKIKKD